ncbi:MAG: hypothetical protein HC892_18685 [Saprospiraceae bacterium]|nr:hypothetical protein [Saprospiraceae bacterium]
MKIRSMIIMLFFAISVPSYAQEYDKAFENTTSYEVFQHQTDTTYTLEIKNPKSNQKYELLRSTKPLTEPFEEEQKFPQIIKIAEMDFDKQGSKEIILEYSIEYTTQKGESGADSKKKNFLKIINLDKRKTLLDKLFYEETSSFFYNHHLSDDFTERSNNGYEYKKRKATTISFPTYKSTLFTFQKNFRIVRKYLDTTKPKIYLKPQNKLHPTLV